VNKANNGKPQAQQSQAETNKQTDSSAIEKMCANIEAKADYTAAEMAQCQKK
jgi:hypothetical protein